MQTFECISVFPTSQIREVQTDTARAPAIQQAAVTRTSSPCTKGSNAERTVSVIRVRVRSSAS